MPQKCTSFHTDTPLWDIVMRPLDELRPRIRSLNIPYFRNLGVSPPFPMIQYDMIYTSKGQGRQSALIAQVVDDILEPSFVVPVNGGSRDFIRKYANDMVSLKFLVLPMQFLLRDGYASMDFTAQVNTAISRDRRSRSFLIADKLGRRAMYTNLIQTLRTNGNTDHIDDSVILQDLYQRRNTEDADEDSA